MKSQSLTAASGLVKLFSSAAPKKRRRAARRLDGALRPPRRGGRRGDPDRVDRDRANT
jgi:hypothetical protein